MKQVTKTEPVIYVDLIHNLNQARLLELSTTSISTMYSVNPQPQPNWNVRLKITTASQALYNASNTKSHIDQKTSMCNKGYHNHNNDIIF